MCTMYEAGCDEAGAHHRDTAHIFTRAEPETAAGHQGGPKFSNSQSICIYHCLVPLAPLPRDQPQIGPILASMREDTKDPDSLFQVVPLTRSAQADIRIMYIKSMIKHILGIN